MLKPGKDPYQTASYRPISLLPILSKVLEKIIYSRLKPIIECKQLIPDHQFGFRSKHSTIEQLHRLVNEIITAIENKQYCTTLFMDIEKTFDEVWHKGLLQTIKTRFPKPVQKLLASYLENRTFVVKIKDTCSDIRIIKAGVPQGSVLGPILYTLYTADIATTDLSKILAFTDDTAILSTHSDPKVAVNTLQNHIEKIEKWLADKKIKANPTKCNHITFTLCKQNSPNITLNNVVIPQTKQTKYLGLQLDIRLTWKQHIKSVIENIKIKKRQMYWLTGKTSKLSVENKLKIYKVIIKPVWTYGISLWETAAKSHISKNHYNRKY